MKKILVILAIISIFLSCSDNNKTVYTLKYVVFYPNHQDTVIVSNTKGYYWNSDRGTNYIKEGSITGDMVYSNSAPYKILSYTEKQLVTK